MTAPALFQSQYGLILVRMIDEGNRNLLRFQSQYGLILVSLERTRRGVIKIFQSQYGLILVLYNTFKQKKGETISIPIWSDFSEESA